MQLPRPQIHLLPMFLGLRSTSRNHHGWLVRAGHGRRRQQWAYYISPHRPHARSLQLTTSSLISQHNIVLSRRLPGRHRSSLPNKPARSARAQFPNHSIQSMPTWYGDTRAGPGLGCVIVQSLRDPYINKAKLATLSKSPKHIPAICVYTSQGVCAVPPL